MVTSLVVFIKILPSLVTSQLLFYLTSDNFNHCEKLNFGRESQEFTSYPKPPGGGEDRPVHHNDSFEIRMK